MNRRQRYRIRERGVGRRSPLLPVVPRQDICLELRDHSTVAESAIDFFAVRGAADPQSQAARLTDQFITQNRRLLDLIQVVVRRDYDGRDVLLVTESGSAVGALPLISPLTAKPDFGLVVQPRFPWSGIGPMLAEMGWLISPSPLRLPLLKRSERRVPPWVLSFMVLTRLKALLDRLDRRFEVVREIRSAPKGTVAWAEYCTRQMPHADFLSVPCTYPDLRDDRRLKGAIRYTVEKQLRSLDTQREHGSFVHRLIALAECILLRVRAVATHRPGPGEIGGWVRRPLRSEVFIEGLQAIDWTLEDRGLAGLSDLEGIPWTMPMEQFFEAWVETVMRAVALRTGGRLLAGRCRETVTPISWDPPRTGSQRALIPDLLFELNGTTVVVDAKYKRHWEELQQGTWYGQDAVLREQHRQDLMQVLAYANLARNARIVCCLIYPCSQATWESLQDRGRVFHRAQIPNIHRPIQVWLTALPMCTPAERYSGPLVEEIRNLEAEQGSP